MGEPTTPRGAYQRSGGGGVTEEHDRQVGDINRQNLPAFTDVVKRLLPGDVKIYLTDLESNVLEVRWILSPDSVDHQEHLQSKVNALRYPWRLNGAEGVRFRLPGRVPFTSDTLVVVRDRLAEKPREVWKTTGIMCCRLVGLVFTCLFVCLVISARSAAK